DNVDVEHDYGDERDDELTFDTSHEGVEYESVRTSTSRNKPIIHHNNIPYLFHQLSKNGLVKFWRCEAFSGPEIKCKARIHTDLDDLVIKEIGSHSCVKGKRDAAKFGTPKDEGTSVDRTLRSATK
uniref:FLYWCH-type domain-containing protein n=1 Tax=Meloidogyne javanica TaxID=6303 RepID=A0A915M098_MELJA